MKNLLLGIKTFLHVAFPKSRWGNVVYLILGLLLAQWEAVVEIISALRLLF